MDQQQIMQIQMMEQEAQQLNQQLQLIEQNVSEMQELELSLEELNKEDSKEDFWINDCQSAINYMHKDCIDYLLVPSFLEEFNCESFSEIGKFRFKPNKSDFNFNSYSIRLFKILPQ